MGSSQSIESRILEASALGDTRVVSQLLSSAPNPYSLANSLDKKGRTPLILACRGGHVETARALVAAGAKASHLPMCRPGTALHTAVSRRDVSMIELLLSSGADPFLENAFEETCLDLAMDPSNGPRLIRLLEGLGPWQGWLQVLSPGWIGRKFKPRWCVVAPRRSLLGQGSGEVSRTQLLVFKDQQQPQPLARLWIDGSKCVLRPARSPPGSVEALLFLHADHAIPTNLCTLSSSRQAGLGSLAGDPQHRTTRSIGAINRLLRRPHLANLAGLWLASRCSPNRPGHPTSSTSNDSRASATHRQATPVHRHQLRLSLPTLRHGPSMASAGPGKAQPTIQRGPAVVSPLKSRNGSPLLRCPQAMSLLGTPTAPLEQLTDVDEEEAEAYQGDLRAPQSAPAVSHHPIGALSDEQLARRLQAEFDREVALWLDANPHATLTGRAPSAPAAIAPQLQRQQQYGGPTCPQQQQRRPASVSSPPTQHRGSYTPPSPYPSAPQQQQVFSGFDVDSSSSEGEREAGRGVPWSRSGTGAGRPQAPSSSYHPPAPAPAPAPAAAVTRAQPAVATEPPLRERLTTFVSQLGNQHSSITVLPGDPFAVSARYPPAWSASQRGEPRRDQTHAHL